MSGAEIWRRLAGFENRYEISDHGRVRRASKFSPYSDPAGTIVSLGQLKSRHLRLTTYIAGKTVNASVHRLVFETFKGPIPSGLEVAHLNGDPTDNRVENLVAITHKENMGHKRLHGTLRAGEEHHMAKLTGADVLAIRESQEAVAVVAERFGICRNHVRSVRNGDSWKHLQAAEKEREAGQ